MRDAYGNRMLDDFSAQLWYHLVDANCDPRDPYDPLCVPVDQVRGGAIFFKKGGRLATLNPLLGVSESVQKKMVELSQIVSRLSRNLLPIWLAYNRCCVFMLYSN